MVVGDAAVSLTSQPTMLRTKSHKRTVPGNSAAHSLCMTIPGNLPIECTACSAALVSTHSLVIRAVNCQDAL